MRDNLVSHLLEFSVCSVVIWYNMYDVLFTRTDLLEFLVCSVVVWYNTWAWDARDGDGGGMGCRAICHRRR